MRTKEEVEKRIKESNQRFELLKKRKEDFFNDYFHLLSQYEDILSKLNEKDFLKMMEKIPNHLWEYSEYNDRPLGGFHDF